MILSDTEIKKLIHQSSLISGHDDKLVKYCGCELRLGKVCLPETGELQWFAGTASPQPQSGGQVRERKCWQVKPSESIVIMTKETVKVPKDLCATYGQLNRLARVGLMLLNTSIVEPGYDGPLSCILVNFSSETVTIFQDQPVAKINFYQVQGVPSLFQSVISPNDYESGIIESATKLPRSLLDVTGIEDRVTEKTGAKIKSGAVWGGAILAFLLIFAQLEPLTSRWLWEKTGLATKTRQSELETLQTNLTLQATVEELNRRNRDLAERLTALESKVK